MKFELRRFAHFVRRPGFLAALAPAALLLLFAAASPERFEELKLRGFDLEERLLPRIERPLPVVIVAIDEASLAPPYGQWPWPRSLVASLVDKIAAARPAALGIDIIFAEPDRLSPPALAQSLATLPSDARAALAGLPDNDARLAAALRTAPTVLGMGPAFAQAPGAGPLRVAPMLRTGPDPSAVLDHYPARVQSLPILAAAESGAAVLAGDPDRDGVVRRVAQLVEIGGTLVPGLAAETLRVALGAGGIRIATEPGGVDALAIGDAVIPTDAQARAYPYFAPPGSAATVSAADLLSGKAAPAALANRIVLLGVTGLGLVDVKSTPVGLMQGIEVHAQLLESILSGAVLRRPVFVPRLELAILVLASLVVLLLPYRRPALASALAVGVAVLCLGGEFAAFRLAHLLLDGIYPAAAALAGYGVMVAANLRAAEAARRRLATALQLEREQKARLQGELDAARAIQMGLLPQSPESPLLETHALIETARMVGGDLYDFVMLDPRRLFFAVADVSGKGVDAAIFMAATKTVLEGTSAQHGTELDRVLGDANAKIAEASDRIRAGGGRPMFVTAFAAVLELDSGLIHYASAGHDAPYRLRRGVAPVRLDSEGGPPLGAIDEFDFPVEHASLEPGDVLLLFTDGVTEAKDEGGAFYGVDRLDRLVAEFAAASARDAVDLVREDVRRFVGGAEQADDITLVALRWCGPSAP